MEVGLLRVLRRRSSGADQLIDGAWPAADGAQGNRQLGRQVHQRLEGLCRLEQVDGAVLSEREQCARELARRPLQRHGALVPAGRKGVEARVSCGRCGKCGRSGR